MGLGVPHLGRRNRPVGTAAVSAAGSAVLAAHPRFEGLGRSAHRMLIGGATYIGKRAALGPLAPAGIALPLGSSAFGSDQVLIRLMRLFHRSGRRRRWQRRCGSWQ